MSMRVTTKLNKHIFYIICMNYLALPGKIIVIVQLLLGVTIIVVALGS